MQVRGGRMSTPGQSGAERLWLSRKTLCHAARDSGGCTTRCITNPGRRGDRGYRDNHNHLAPLCPGVDNGWRTLRLHNFLAVKDGSLLNSG